MTMEEATELIEKQAMMHHRSMIVKKAAFLEKIKASMEKSSIDEGQFTEEEKAEDNKQHLSYDKGTEACNDNYETDVEDNNPNECASKSGKSKPPVQYKENEDEELVCMEHLDIDQATIHSHNSSQIDIEQAHVKLSSGLEAGSTS